MQQTFKKNPSQTQGKKWLLQQKMSCNSSSDHMHKLNTNVLRIRQEQFFFRFSRFRLNQTNDCAGFFLNTKSEYQWSAYQMFKDIPKFYKKKREAVERGKQWVLMTFSLDETVSMWHVMKFSCCWVDIRCMVWNIHRLVASLTTN